MSDEMPAETITYLFICIVCQWWNHIFPNRDQSNTEVQVTELSEQVK